MHGTMEDECVQAPIMDGKPMAERLEAGIRRIGNSLGT